MRGGAREDCARATVYIAVKGAGVGEAGRVADEVYGVYVGDGRPTHWAQEEGAALAGVVLRFECYEVVSCWIPKP